MLVAELAVLLHLKLARLILLVLGDGVIAPLAILTGQKNYISHDYNLYCYAGWKADDNPLTYSVNQLIEGGTPLKGRQPGEGEWPVPHTTVTSKAHDQNRTGDLLLTMQMLYRLSYVGRSKG